MTEIKKKIYVMPELEITAVYVADIITASGDPLTDGTPDYDNGAWT